MVKFVTNDIIHSLAEKIQSLTYLASPEVQERLNKIPTKVNEFGIDPFGFKPQFVKIPGLFAKFFYKYYFRAQTYGIENIPNGRCLLIANHSGQIPIDGMIIAISVFLEKHDPIMVRSMVEKWVARLPFVSNFFAKCGQIVGTPENCSRLLQNEECILAFPEGVKGISKPISQR